MSLLKNKINTVNRSSQILFPTLGRENMVYSIQLTPESEAKFKTHFASKE